MMRPASSLRRARVLLTFFVVAMHGGVDGCVDREVSCKMWAAAGECENNPLFMHDKCALSCETCDKQRRSCDDIGDDDLQEGGIAARFERLLSLHHYSPHVLSRDPWVVRLDSFIGAAEAEEVIRVGGHKFERSLAGSANGFVEARTSSTSWCNVKSCEHHPVMVWLKERITAAMDISMNNTEHLQVLRYESGQFYRTHHDQNSPMDSPPGPRVFTFFVYLSNVTAGGATRFPRLGLEVSPKVGSALVWPSVRDDDVYREDPRTEHEAVAVGSGVKYAANFWSHLRDFQNPHAAGCGTDSVPSAVQRRKQPSGGRSVRKSQIPAPKEPPSLASVLETAGGERKEEL